MNWPQRIVIVRHAESRRNVIRRAESGRGGIFPEDIAYRESVPDHKVHLTSPRGEEQAFAAGRQVAKEFPHFDVAYHSGYERTKKTLAGVLAAYPEEVRRRIPIREDILLREREGGRAFLMDFPTEIQTFPWWEKHWKVFGRMFARPETGESVAMVADRINTAFLKISLDHAGQNVLMAMHGRVIVTVRMILEGWTIDEAEHFMRGDNPERPKNAGITIYEYSETARKMVLVEYNRHCGYHDPQPKAAA